MSLGVLSLPQLRFDRVPIDIVGQLLPDRGYTHILTRIDRFIRLPEAIPPPNITADTVGRASISG